MFCVFTVILTFDLRPPDSNQFILVSNLFSNFEDCSNGTDGETAQNIMPPTTAVAGADA